MTGDSPRTPADSQARAARRAFVRANHPDVGGDIDEFIAGLERFRGDRQQPSDSAPREADRFDAPIVVVVRKRGALGAIRRWRDRRKRPRRVL